MTRINRDQFRNEFQSGIDIDSLSDETKAALNKAGITDRKLAEIAQGDGKIEGKELDQLFNAMDSFDNQPSDGYIVPYLNIAQNVDVRTPTGEAYELLKSELHHSLTRSRMNGPETGKQNRMPGTYVGKNPFLPAHGYANYSRVEEKYGYKWPMDIEMAGGKKLKPIFVEDSGALLNMSIANSPKRGVLLKHEGRTVLGAIENNGWMKFYEPDKRGPGGSDRPGQSDQLRFNGQNWKPLERGSDKKNVALSEVFKNSFDVVNGRIDAKLDPESQKQVDEDQYRKLMGPVKNKLPN